MAAVGLLIAGRRGLVASVGEEFSAFHGVMQAGVQDVNQTPAAVGIFHRDQQFDAPIEIAWHPVGTGEEHTFVTAVKEIDQPTVFQKAVDDAHHANAFAESRHAGSETADASHVQFDVHSGL